MLDALEHKLALPEAAETVELRQVWMLGLCERKKAAISPARRRVVRREPSSPSPACRR